MKTRLKKLLFAVTLCFCCAAVAQADLAERINAVINRSSQKKVLFAVNVIKADTGEVLYAHNDQKPMLPASNMKLITTAAALKSLGPDFEYKTRIGLLENNLVIIGSGDPLLGDKITDTKYARESGWIFKNIADTLKKNSITDINDIIVDTSIFDDQAVHTNWPGDQLNRGYACEVSGLNYNANCIDVTVENINGAIKISTDPATAFVKITNKVEPVKKGKSAVGSYRGPTPNDIVVFGKCQKRQGPFSVAIQRPAAFFAFLLAENLATAQIKTNGRIVEIALNTDTPYRLLAEYKTPLTDCLSRCNKDSFGLVAESLLKTIAASSGPDNKNGNWQKGREIISSYLSSLGISPDSFYIDDASGLSKKNKLSANAITTVLHSIYKTDKWPIYKNSLAVAGVDGTIEKYFNDQKYQGRIFGKTGYIAGVKSFSGLASTDNGDYIFSILTDKANAETTTARNDIAKAIIDTCSN